MLILFTLLIAVFIWLQVWMEKQRRKMNDKVLRYQLRVIKHSLKLTRLVLYIALMLLLWQHYRYPSIFESKNVRQENGWLERAGFAEEGVPISKVLELNGGDSRTYFLFEEESAVFLSTHCPGSWLPRGQRRTEKVVLATMKPYEATVYFSNKTVSRLFGTKGEQYILSKRKGVYYLTKILVSDDFLGEGQVEI